MPKITFEPTFMSAEIVEVVVSEGVSIQEAAEDAGVPMGDACGGNCGCSTCHVHILEGFSSLEEMEDDEDDILGKANDVQHHSRLGCQAFVNSEDLRVRITRESQLSFINEHPEYRDEASKVGYR